MNGSDATQLSDHIRLLRADECCELIKAAPLRIPKLKGKNHLDRVGFSLLAIYLPHSPFHPLVNNGYLFVALNFKAAFGIVLLLLAESKESSVLRAFNRSFQFCCIAFANILIG